MHSSGAVRVSLVCLCQVSVATFQGLYLRREWVGVEGLLLPENWLCVSPLLP